MSDRPREKEMSVFTSHAESLRRAPLSRRPRSCLTALLIAGPIAFALGGAGARSQALETVPAGEEQAIRTIVSLALAALQKRYDAREPLVRRDAHAKAHGCVKATFRVASDLPAELRVGLASRSGQEFKAWVRFSNGSFEPGSDAGMDGRGMALKIMGPPSSESADMTHDVLMINHPVFFSPDANDYLDFVTAGALIGEGDGLKKYFVPSLNPARWRVSQGLIAYRIASQKISSPLSTQYFSMVPFLFGSGRAVKYSARPCVSVTRPSESSVDRIAGDFLKTAMQQELRSGPACFEFMVQEQRGTMPIEDATVEWSQRESPYRPIGTITILRQEFDTAERTAFCENTAFNPWNAPAMHKPLGGVNRIRKVLYEEISRYRHNRNSVTTPDPLEAWDRF